MHHKAKAPFKLVEEVRQLRKLNGWTFSKLAAIYNLSMWTVRDWCEYRTRIGR
jgi:DNA-binding transcriptional regulator YiaG